jgi:hypothetical protein
MLKRHNPRSENGKIITTKLIWIDWMIIATILTLSLAIGVLVSLRASAKSSR